MSMNDPIADMLTRIRNGQNARLKNVSMPASHCKEAIAVVLRDEGYIDSFSVVDQPGNHPLSSRVYDLCVSRHSHVISRADIANAPTIDNDCGVTNDRA